MTTSNLNRSSANHPEEIRQMSPAEYVRTRHTLGLLALDVALDDDSPADFIFMTHCTGLPLDHTPSRSGSFMERPTRLRDRDPSAAFETTRTDPAPARQTRRCALELFAGSSHSNSSRDHVVFGRTCRWVS